MSRLAAAPITEQKNHGLDRRWLKRFDRRLSSPKVRLLCFHHAGGSATIFRSWPARMAPDVEPIAVQLPGRAERYGEAPFEHMAPLVDNFVDVITPLLDRPFAFYGVSMGARVAWNVARALRERRNPMPITLFLACARAPMHDDGTFSWDGHPDGLEGYLRDMRGTPPEVLADPEFLRVLLPTLRADLTLLTTATGPAAAPLNIPIRCFAGADDLTAPMHTMSGWAAETTARFELDVVPGRHFFGSEGERRVIEAIGDDLVTAGRHEGIDDH